MTLYFDTKIEFLDSDAVSTISSWHPNEPLFAVASYSQERGGSVTIFADTVSFISLGIEEQILVNIFSRENHNGMSLIQFMPPHKQLLCAGIQRRRC